MCISEFPQKTNRVAVSSLMVPLWQKSVESQNHLLDLEEACTFHSCCLTLNFLFLFVKFLFTPNHLNRDKAQVVTHHKT